MIRNSSALATYNKVASLETDPLQQIVMLYNGAIKFLRLAATDIEANDRISKAEHSSRALEIIQYLQAILDFEQGKDVARSLDALYTNVTTIVLKASSSLDAQMMRRAADLLAPVCDAWATNASLNTAQPQSIARAGMSSLPASLNRQA